nr:MAG: nonstructural polyprotein [Astroviridae sp.]
MAFSSLSVRHARQIQNELNKMIGGGAVNDVLARAKEKANGCKLWSKFMSKTIACVPHTVDSWTGLTRDGNWIHYKKGNIVNLDVTQESKLTMVEEAMCKEKLFAETRKRHMEEMIKHQNNRMREMSNEMVILRKRSEKLSQKLTEIEAENIRLKKENSRLHKENVTFRARDEVRNESSYKTIVGLQQLTLMLAFLFFMWLIPATTAQQYGCKVLEVPIKMEPLDYDELSRRCWNTQNNLILSGQFDENYAYVTCMTTTRPAEECRNMTPQMVLERVTIMDIIGKYLDPVVQLVNKCTEVYSYAQWFNLDQIALISVALCLSTSWGRVLIGILVHLICYITGSKPFPLLLALNYLPIISAPFLAVNMILPAELMMIVALAHCVTLVIDAYLSGELTLMQRLSGCLLNTTVFVGWQLVDLLLRTVNITFGTQVCICVLVSLTTVGYKAATGIVTVTNPDGTVEKYKRYTQVKKTIAEKISAIAQKAKAIRGVLPAFPIVNDAICVVEVKTRDEIYIGTGFRMGNYIYTAGHVVTGAESVTLKWNNLNVQGCVIGEIELPGYTDTLARIKIPSAFSLMRSLKIAREKENDYFQMVTFGQNGEPATFTGWGSIDEPYFAAPFASHAGTSGSPVIDRTGKVVAVHFGTNLACSSGYVIVDLFRVEPPLKQSGRTEDELMEKILAGVRSATADINAKVEKTLIKVNAIEDLARDLERKQAETSGVVTRNAQRYNSKIPEIEEKIKSLEDKLEQLLTNVKEEKTLVEEQAKGKTKKTTRGAKHRYTKVAKHVRRNFNKMKMLTEEEYKRLEDEGFTADEIRDVVNELREQAFLAWQIDNEDDWDENPGWSSGEESDEEYIEKAFEDQKARLKVYKEKEGKQKSIDIKYPDGAEAEARETLRKVLTDENVPPEETHVVIYCDDEGAMYVDDKRVTLKKIKFEGHTKILKNKETVISGEPQEQKVQKISTTTVVEHKPEEGVEGNETHFPPAKEQRKREWKRYKYRADDNEMCTCNGCGVELPLRKAIKHRCQKNPKGAPSGAQ